MRSTCCLIFSLFICAPLTAAPPVGGGRVIPNEGGINGFAPEWNEDDFDLAGYLESVGPDANIWFQHVQTLSNQWMEGRQPGTPGDELAARYIIWYFNRAGLEPAFEGSWRQPFSFTLGRSLPEVHSASLSTPNHDLVHGEDFGVLANSGSLASSMPLSFVGYGIEDGPEGYTSFAEGDDLTGRAVLLLRYEPLDEEGRSQWAEGDFSPHSGIQDKFGALTDRGAAAILMVNPVGAVDGREGIESVATTTGFRPRLDIPAMHISAETATALLHAASNGTASLHDLQEDANEGVVGVRHFDNDAMVTIATDLSVPTFDTQNVAGVLPGTGDLADEWVIVGGHYDHIGHGYTGSRAPGDTRVHPGADDNASGVGTILVL
ncbi:MAG: M28 family peptidase, partial [Phycisphaerae bacterium]|nr:M28 family peptidase [Phycisphaerae bacterium]